jgi:hypothetical protein
VSDTPPSGPDTTVPHSARIWNYWLGGKDNYAVDRAAGDQFLATFPDIAVVARATRAFMGRAVRYLAGEAGIRQFLDIGTGLPTADTPMRCCAALRRARLTTLTRTCATREPSSPALPRRWT